MTFIISLVVLVAMFVLMGFKILEAAVAMALVGTIVGYWIRDVQDKLTAGQPTTPGAV
jgi:hypothetical protein